MNIKKATQQYEAWLAERTTLVGADLDFKHQQMTEGAFPFLRATFYRWAQVFPEACPDLAKAPRLAARGDGNDDGGNAAGLERLEEVGRLRAK